MSHLRTLKNRELLDTTFRLAGEERRITLAVLEHLREIERRKAYSDLGYRSLFEYAVTHLRYSEGSASRRISAMHALREHPELAPRIEAGETSVTTVARIQSTIRRDEKISDLKWAVSEKRRVFKEMGPLPMKDLDRRLFELAPVAAVQERIRPLSDHLHEVKIYLTSEDLAALDSLRAARAHSMKNPGSTSELVQNLIRTGIEELEQERSRDRKIHSGGVRSALHKNAGSRSGKGAGAGVPAAGGTPTHETREAVPFEALEAVPFEALEAVPFETREARPPETRGDLTSETNSAPAPRAIRARRDASPLAGKWRSPISFVTAATRRAVFRRAGYRCEYILPNKHRCDSKFRLEIEHRVPRARGGTNDVNNLEILCRDHNQIRGIQAFGPDRMRRK